MRLGRMLVQAEGTATTAPSPDHGPGACRSDTRARLARKGGRHDARLDLWRGGVVQVLHDTLRCADGLHHACPAQHVTCRPSHPSMGPPCAGCAGMRHRVQQLALRTGLVPARCCCHVRPTTLLPGCPHAGLGWSIEHWIMLRAWSHACRSQRHGRGQRTAPLIADAEAGAHAELLQQVSLGQHAARYCSPRPRLQSAVRVAPAAAVDAEDR